MWSRAIDWDIGFPRLTGCNQFREKRENRYAYFVTTVGGHPDGRSVWNQRHWQMELSAVCLRYSMGRVYEVPSFPAVANFICWRLDVSLPEF
jgi:hypothetical protein